MKGKLLNILFDLVHTNAGKTIEYEPQNLIIHVNSFWHRKIEIEIRENEVLYWRQQANLQNDEGTSLNIMGHKVTFVVNKGEIRSAATDEFFELVYNKLP